LFAGIAIGFIAVRAAKPLHTPGGRWLDHAHFEFGDSATGDWDSDDRRLDSGRGEARADDWGDEAGAAPAALPAALPAFDRIELQNGGRFEIGVGKPQNVVARSAASGIRTEVRDGTLVIGGDNGASAAHWQISVPVLRGLRVQGGGEFVVRGLQGDEFQLDCDGAGNFVLEGAVASLELNLGGAGRIDAHRLIAQRAIVRVDGAGLARVNAVQSLNAQLNGLGAIRYSGRPPELQREINGLGLIEAE
jgi:hypothetical protein